MAVYEYMATNKRHEDTIEVGTVIAATPEEAAHKLKLYRLEDVKLKKLTGLSGFFKSFTADIK